MVSTGQGMGWLVLVFFGVLMLIATVAMLPGAGALALDGTGFEVTNLYRRTQTRWQDVSDFTAARIPPARQRFVLYNNRQVSGTLAEINVSIAARSASLPDTYGLAADELAQVMKEWCERAERQPSGVR
jgi:hypothetical protein